MFGKKGSDGDKPEAKKKLAPKIEAEEKKPAPPVEEPGGDDAPAKKDPPPVDKPVPPLKADDENLADKDDPKKEKLKKIEAPDMPSEKTANALPVKNSRIERARKRIWSDLREGIDLKSLARMDSDAAREEILGAVTEIGQFRSLDLTKAELAQVAKEAADDMLGFGPLEELLEMEGIADIMINGPKTIYIELKEKYKKDAESITLYGLNNMVKRIIDKGR